LSVHGEPAVNNIFLAVHRFSALHDLAMFGDIPKGLHQALGIAAGETERHEELCLSAVVRVSVVAKIVDDLATIDDSEVSISIRRAP
jgi:hypothetical protein